MKNQKGITLIALVITIIVLLILAGVSIAMLTGQNGILTKATTATTKTKEAEIKEALSLASSTIMADRVDPTVSTAPEMDYSGIAAQIKKDNAASDATATTDGMTYKIGEKTYKVTYSFLPTSDTDDTAIGVDISSVVIVEQ